MFTGIIEHIGRVLALQGGPSGAALRIALGPVAQGLKLGDSVAIDGVCLTLTQLDGEAGRFDVGPESLQRSTLGHLRAGQAVHLERALRADGRLDGHIVQGHVDAVAQVVTRNDRGQAVDLKLQVRGSDLSLVVEKGSIAMAGVSLTVNHVSGDSFSVSLIPFTQGQTYLPDCRVGDRLNIEFDIVGRYVARLMRVPQAGAVSLDLLKENGFA